MKKVLLLVLLFASSNLLAFVPDAVVAADGSGDYTSIQAAIMKAPYHHTSPPWIIQVKPGTYDERIYVQRERGYIRLVGDDPATTIISGNLHANMPGADGEPIGTFRTPTMQIDGDGFEIENMTIENTAGPVGQALALRTDGDKLVFRNCRFLGWQDTIFINRGRLYFEDCTIEGHVDFIFGGATAWFEDCRIHSRKGGYLTAASTPPDQPYGFIFNHCTISGTEGSQYYLGRPWRPYAMTAFIDCEIDAQVRPEGWNNWGKATNEETVRYGELRSTGPGASPDQRVPWAKAAPDGLTPAKVLGGTDGWNPVAGVTGARGWQDVDAVLDRIQPPAFPDRDFPITKFGAMKGQDCTKAIRAAINACNKAGGGRVVVPEGKWLTSALFLRSNVNLHISEGATLEWTFNLDDYPVVFTRWEGVECMNFSPFIYAYEQENIAITGKGTLDGGASNDTWWLWNPKDKTLLQGKHSLQHEDRLTLIEMGARGVPVAKRVFGKGHYLRTNFIQPYRCKNVLIEGVTILRSPMWEIHPVLSTNITVRGVTITTHGPNNDGCDPESCRDVLIEDTLFDTGDDCIAIKSGRNNDGRRVNEPTENVIVRNCIMKDGHGGVVLGSECSGHIRNIWVENCRMDSPNLDRALRFKNNAVRGGILENVFMRDVQIGQVAEAVLTIDLLYEEGEVGDYKPIVRNVQMERISSSASPRVMFIRGFEDAIIDDIRISDSSFEGVTHTEVVEYAGLITLENVNIMPATGLKPRHTVPKAPVGEDG